MKVQKTNLSDIKDVLRGPFDVFICSGSFEERCLSVTLNIDITKIKKALVITNSDLLEHVGKNSSRLTSYLGNISVAVEVKTNDPLLSADNIDSNLNSVIGLGFTGSILLDITAFTHESLLILLRLLLMKAPAAKITCVYANASEYSLGDEVRHKWLSRGIGEVRSVLGYPGKLIPSRKTHLILIVGYEHERAAGIIEEIEPNTIALGYGRSGSATTDKDKDANERYMHLVEHMATSYSEVNCFEIPCDDPVGTRDIIQDQIAKARDKNILLAPMNNKLSTIGAALAALNNDSVQVCYVQALRYNYLGYSSPGTKCYVFNLNWH